MTGKDFGYYALAAALFAASIPLYRYIIERGRVGDQPAQSRQPAVVVYTAPPVAQAQPVRLPDSGGPLNRVECRDGYLFEVTPQGPVAVSRNGRLSRCQIQVEPVRPQNSEATD